MIQNETMGKGKKGNRSIEGETGRETYLCSPDTVGG